MVPGRNSLTEARHTEDDVLSLEERHECATPLTLPPPGAFSSQRRRLDPTEAAECRGAMTEVRQALPTGIMMNNSMIPFSSFEECHRQAGR
jgi:hypothetical protein